MKSVRTITFALLTSVTVGLTASFSAVAAPSGVASKTSQPKPPPSGPPGNGGGEFDGNAGGNGAGAQANRNPTKGDNENELEAEETDAALAQKPKKGKVGSSLGNQTQPEGTIPGWAQGTVKAAKIPLRDPVKSAEAFEQQVKNAWALYRGVPGEISEEINRLDELEPGVAQPVLFRTISGLTKDDAMKIIKEGSVSGYYRGMGLNVETAREGFNAELGDVSNYEKLARAAASHKASEHDKSELVSTTSDVRNTYGDAGMPGKYGLAIMVIPEPSGSDSDRVYSSKQIAKNLRLFGISAEGKDYESEYLFGGGIPKDRVYYALLVEVKAPQPSPGTGAPRIDAGALEAQKKKIMEGQKAREAGQTGNGLSEEQTS